MNSPLEVLLVEDDEDDVRLTQEAMKHSASAVKLNVAADGEKALQYLRREGSFSRAPRPDIILMDLNLPGMNGREVIAKLKSDPALKSIPVLVLTTSKAESDVLTCYGAGANCYISKPVDFEQFVRIIKAIDEFWFAIAKLPRSEA